jgi:hypothetical protein
MKGAPGSQPRVLVVSMLAWYSEVPGLVLTVATNIKPKFYI